MRKKYDETIKNYQSLIENQGNIELILTKKIDDYGEILHGSLIDEIKQINIDIIKTIKDQDQAPPKLQELWKISNMDLMENKNKEFLIENFQRKIDGIIDDNIIDTNQSSIKKQVRNDTDIIVVASLLDKIPNIANLTRTCEVFGINQLVINNQKILEDDGFRQITVTADKWMPTIEVQEKDLLQFLLMKKKLGYTIVGLEQTSKSVMIQDYQFVDKCVLVLGKEKIGIPVELIDVLDVCIEIPQYGIIRSLNVHISAVISIWEFVKQKYIKNTQK